MVAYYNEFDPYAAEWLKILINKGLIADGDVDSRSITEVSSDDLQGYTQCHFFAGIGIWSLALRQAGWSDDTPVWTGSCPCQPFSTAGRQEGKNDERHLWPTWFGLIKECQPSVIFGEQVASAITKGWLDDVYEGLEDENYAIGSSVLTASAVGAPHKRERLYFVAESDSIGREKRSEKRRELQTEQGNGESVNKHSGRNETRGTLGDTQHNGSSTATITGSNETSVQYDQKRSDSTCQSEGTSRSCNVADTCCKRQQRQGELQRPLHTEEDQERETSGIINDCSRYSKAEWITCPDGKQRLIEPSIPLLVNGDTNRVGRLCAYGNAIHSEVATSFIRAYKTI